MLSFVIGGGVAPLCRGAHTILPLAIMSWPLVRGGCVYASSFYPDKQIAQLLE